MSAIHAGISLKTKYFKLFFLTQKVDLANFSPWRAGQPVAAGRIRLGLKIILGYFRIRDWWNPKSRKFRSPETKRTYL